MCNVQQLKKRIQPQSFYEKELRGRLGRSSGQDWHAWQGLCPFHADKKAGSFFVNKRTGAFKCFSCGAQGGSIIDFYMQFYNASFKQSTRELGGRF